MTSHFHSVVRCWGRFWLLLLATSALVGCSAVGDPGTPALTSEAPATFPTLLTGTQSAIAPLGLYELTLDASLEHATLTPVAARSGQGFDLGDSLIPDLTSLFRDSDSLCGDCVKVTGVGADSNGLPYVDLDVRHPLASGRPELSAFDLQLVLISDEQPGLLTTVSDFGVDLYPPYLINADGATDQITAAVEFATGRTLNGEVFPFINVATDATEGNFAGDNINGFADVTHPSGHNVFASGDLVTARLELDTRILPKIRLYLAVTGSFYRSYTSRGDALYQKNSPVYFLPEGNRKEAWRVTTEVVGNALLAGDPTSSAQLEINIWDWQNGLTPAGNWDPSIADPATQPRDTIPETSDIARVMVSVPGVTSGAVDVTSDPHTGTGRTQADPVAYEVVSISNDAAGVAGTYTGVVRVRDSRNVEPGTPGEGEILFNDGATFGTLANFDTYSIFQLEVADDYVFVGSDFSHTGNRLRRTGSIIEVDTDFFTDVAPTISNAAIRNGRVYVVTSGPAFSGMGAIEVFDLGSGAELLEYTLPLSPNPFDLAFIDDDEVYVTGFISGEVYRLNVDPDFAGTRLVATVNLNPYADPGFLPRPQEILRTATGRYFVACGHFDGSFVPAPAGILVEIEAAGNTVVRAVDTLGLANAWSPVEVAGADRLTVIGPGTYIGDGGSGTFNLAANSWSLDPNPPGLAWTEGTVNSFGRGFTSDAFTATVAHAAFPFGGTINHQLQVVPPPGPPFPFISAVAVDRGDYLYATEFEGTVRVWDTSATSDTVAPTVVGTFMVGGGVDAIGVLR